MSESVAETFRKFLGGEEVQATPWWKELDWPDLVRTLFETGQLVKAPDDLCEGEKSFRVAVREAVWDKSGLNGGCYQVKKLQNIGPARLI